MLREMIHIFRITTSDNPSSNQFKSTSQTQIEKSLVLQRQFNHASYMKQLHKEWAESQNKN